MLGELLGPAPDAPTALLATLWFGANDAALIDKGHGWVHVPLDTYVANLKTLIATLKQHAHHVVVITPPRIDGPGRLAFQVRKYGNSATGELERCNSENKRYAAAAVQVAADSGAHVVDLYSAMESAADWRDMLVDGLHFTPHGQRFVFAQLKQVLDTIPELAADTVPRLFPHVTELQDQ
jgi:lysophospholipase L1-like esterase